MEVFRFGQPRHCALCGRKLAERAVKAGEPVRLVCSACGYIAYGDLKVAACIVCHLEGKLLLLRRGIEPGYGKWVFPGGLLDRGKRWRRRPGAKREGTGVEVEIERLLNVYSYPGGP